MDIRIHNQNLRLCLRSLKNSQSRPKLRDPRTKTDWEKIEKSRTGPVPRNLKNLEPEQKNLKI